jgi:hypothetical protein
MIRAKRYELNRNRVGRGRTLIIDVGPLQLGFESGRGVYGYPPSPYFTMHACWAPKRWAPKPKGAAE